MMIPVVQLNDGNQVPQLGLGVWQLGPDDTERVVNDALEAGYRHFDTAPRYENEKEVGRAIASSGIPRDELFVTTKLWNDSHEDPHGGFQRSLEQLGLDKIDLYLIHFPLPHDGTAVTAWRGLVEILGSPECDSVGVSNFEVDHLQQLLRETGVVPAVNQIELHPLHQRRDVRAFCAEQGIAIEAWGPLAQGHSEVLRSPVIAEIAAVHGKSIAQTVLRWNLQHGSIVIPKTSNTQRLTENAGVFDFSLSNEQMAVIDGLDQQKRFGADPLTVRAPDKE